MKKMSVFLVILMCFFIITGCNKNNKNNNDSKDDIKVEESTDNVIDENDDVNSSNDQNSVQDNTQNNDNNMDNTENNTQDNNKPATDNSNNNNNQTNNNNQNNSSSNNNQTNNNNQNNSSSNNNQTNNNNQNNSSSNNNQTNNNTPTKPTVTTIDTNAILNNLNYITIEMPNNSSNDGPSYMDFIAKITDMNSISNLVTAVKGGVLNSTSEMGFDSCPVITFVYKDGTKKIAYVGDSKVFAFDNKVYNLSNDIDSIVQKLYTDAFLENKIIDSDQILKNLDYITIEMPDENATGDPKYSDKIAKITDYEVLSTFVKVFDYREKVNINGIGFDYNPRITLKYKDGSSKIVLLSDDGFHISFNGSIYKLIGDLNEVIELLYDPESYFENNIIPSQLSTFKIAIGIAVDGVKTEIALASMEDSDYEIFNTKCNDGSCDNLIIDLTEFKDFSSILVSGIIIVKGKDIYIKNMATEDLTTTPNLEILYKDLKDEHVHKK